MGLKLQISIGSACCVDSQQSAECRKGDKETKDKGKEEKSLSDWLIRFPIPERY